MATRAKNAAAAEMNAPAMRFQAAAADAPARLILSGRWTTRRIAAMDGELARLAVSPPKALDIDLGPTETADTAGAWLVVRTMRQLAKAGSTVSLTGASPDWTILLEAVSQAPDAPPRRAATPFSGLIADMFYALGKTVTSYGNDFLVGMHMLGATIRGAQLKLGRGHGISFAAIVHQIDRMGIGAFPVVIMMSTIIGAIIAQQGAFQLRYFGAEIFVVDLVGVLQLREIGVLLTAIMVAGRSGSAITAEIGSMKMREEIDALKVIGLNPIGVLVFPRLVALVVALPILTVLADLAGLFGASMVAWSYSGISPAAFIVRLREAIDLTTYFAGLIKAPFMALIIGLVSAVEGMKVQGSAESLGSHVTASVVKTIFVVIVVDGLFAMFYAAIDF